MYVAQCQGIMTSTLLQKQGWGGGFTLHTVMHWVIKASATNNLPLFVYNHKFHT
jgi:hypothetical protein